MNHATLNSCLDRIRLYMNVAIGGGNGYPVIVNVEAPEDYRHIKDKMESDPNTDVLRASGFCKDPDCLVSIEDCLHELLNRRRYAVFGLSQYLQLMGEDAITNELSHILNCRVAGLAVIVLYGMGKELKKRIARDLRLEQRIHLLAGEAASRPTIYFATSSVVGDMPSRKGFRELLAFLEDMPKHEDKEADAVLLEDSEWKPQSFHHSLYDLQDSPSGYAAACKIAPEIKGVLIEKAGTKEQWEMLASLLRDGSIDKIVKERFHVSMDELDDDLAPLNAPEPDEVWLYWLALKLSRPKGAYLAKVLEKSTQSMDFVDGLYNTILDYGKDDPDYAAAYLERKKLLGRLQDDAGRMHAYCTKIGFKGRQAPYYLTDRSEEERHALMECLNKFRHSEDELRDIFDFSFPRLAEYFAPFIFRKENTALSSTLPIDDADGVCERLTAYFSRYRHQKLINTVDADFENEVNAFAEEKIFYKVFPRSKVVGKAAASMNAAQDYLCFCDALGVEFIPYIQAWCSRNGLACEVNVARAELPAITAENKEFFADFFMPGLARGKFDKLDELKHDTQKFDFVVEGFPSYIFDELRALDTCLSSIHKKIVQGAEKALLVSDHGASRLAVLAAKDRPTIDMGEAKGRHSGRCCPCDTKPEMAHTIYIDVDDTVEKKTGYAVLADYGRFKGSRPGAIEVHGGATLEEILVPVIEISRCRESIIYMFAETEFTAHRKNPARIIVSASAAFRSPQLSINGQLVDGTFKEGDKNKAVFEVVIKRGGTYAAQLYDNSVQVSEQELVFKSRTETRDMGL